MQPLKGDERADAIARVQAYFSAQRGEELGELAAGEVLEFVHDQLAWMFYNQGVADARATNARFAASLDEELDVLARLPPR